MANKTSAQLKAQFEGTDPEVHNNNLVDATMVNPIVEGDITASGNVSAVDINASGTDANLSDSSDTVNVGNANNPYAAHAFIVAGGAGTTDGSTLTLTVTGTSITDAGVRTPADSQVIVIDATGSVTDQYYETSKKWLGQITFTLASDGSTFAYDFNYGLCKYEDYGNRDFTATDFEVVGLAGANDSGFNVELIHHKATGWTYAATGFVAGPAALLNMATIHGTENNLVNGEQFAFKRSELEEAVSGSDSEGLVIHLTTGSNNAVEFANFHIGVTF